MIRRPTVVYIIALVVVAGVYFYMNTREQPADLEATPQATGNVSYLFTAEEGVPTSITIQANSGEVVEVERDPENAWMVKQPIEAEAEQGASEAAASQITTMRLLERIPTIDPEVVGLREPAYRLTVKFNTGTERTIHVGVVTPTESGYYVQDASGGDVLIVSKSSVDALLRLLTAPPYLETPVPSPGPAGSSTVSPGTTSTPSLP